MEINGFSINFDQASTEGHNLAMIMDRRAGQKFVVKNGRLQVVAGILQTLLYHLFRSRKQRAVKQVISALNQSIDQHKIETIAKKEKGEEAQADFLKTLYFERMARLSKRVFDRSSLTDEVEQILMPSIQNWKDELDARLELKNEHRDSADFEESQLQKDKSQVREARYAHKVHAVTLALQLGCEFKRLSGGSSGTYLALDRRGTPLLVFKPEDEEPNSGNSPKFIQRVKTAVRKWLPCLGGHHCLRPQQGYKAEEAASMIDAALGLHIVPYTRTQVFCSRKFHVHKSKRALPEVSEREKTGSCQEFKARCQSATEKLGLFAWTPSFFVPSYISCRREKAEEIISRQQLEKLAILDFIIANLDRHYGNWLIKAPKNPEKDAKIVAIDNGLSLPYKHPDDFFAKRCEFYWGTLPQASQPFSPEAQELVKKFEDKAFRDEFFLMLQPYFVDEEQQRTMQERIDVLCYCAANGYSPKDLSRIKTSEDILAFKSAAAVAIDVDSN